MNKEKLKLWVDALRSGDYAQGTGALGKDCPGGLKLCCLGVACEVAIKDGLDLPVSRGTVVDDAQGWIRQYGQEKTQGFLPVAVTQWLGHDSDNVLLERPDGSTELAAYLNDTEGWDFAQIADALERTYLKEEK